MNCQFLYLHSSTIGAPPIPHPLPSFRHQRTPSEQGKEGCLLQDGEATREGTSVGFGRPCDLEKLSAAGDF
ncbi:unnamed protein product [Linum trigynum]|uniref:Uncharacterized protein n=1 Tax=Linum trigynum TaxID=586398 RepID=A0AAV2DB52_9ROSI